MPVQIRDTSWYSIREFHRCPQPMTDLFLFYWRHWPHSFIVKSTLLLHSMLGKLMTLFPFRYLWNYMFLFDTVIPILPISILYYRWNDSGIVVLTLKEALTCWLFQTSAKGLLPTNIILMMMLPSQLFIHWPLTVEYDISRPTIVVFPMTITFLRYLQIWWYSILQCIDLAIPTVSIDWLILMMTLLYSSYWRRRDDWPVLMILMKKPKAVFSNSVVLFAVFGIIVVTSLMRDWLGIDYYSILLTGKAWYWLFEALHSVSLLISRKVFGHSNYSMKSGNPTVFPAVTTRFSVFEEEIVWRAGIRWPVTYSTGDRRPWYSDDIEPMVLLSITDWPRYSYSCWPCVRRYYSVFIRCDTLLKFLVTFFDYTTVSTLFTHSPVAKFRTTPFDTDRFHLGGGRRRQYISFFASNAAAGGIPTTPAWYWRNTISIGINSSVFGKEGIIQHSDLRYWGATFIVKEGAWSADDSIWRRPGEWSDRYSLTIFILLTWRILEVLLMMLTDDPTAWETGDSDGSIQCRLFHLYSIPSSSDLKRRRGIPTCEEISLTPDLRWRRLADVMTPVFQWYSWPSVTILFG